MEDDVGEEGSMNKLTQKLTRESEVREYHENTDLLE
jgi:hypothetical protein